MEVLPFSLIQDMIPPWCKVAGMPLPDAGGEGKPDSLWAVPREWCCGTGYTLLRRAGCIS